MKKINLKKSILALSIIFSMLAPMICNDVVYAIDDTTEKDIVSPEEDSLGNLPEDSLESSTESPTVSATPENNTVDNVVENKEDENTDEQDISEEERASNGATSTETTSNEKEEKETSKIRKASVSEQIAPISEEGVTTVYAGDGTLQRAINNAKDGDTLILHGGNYNNNAGPIIINKSITIKTTGNIPYIYQEVQIQSTNKESNVVLDGVAFGMLRTSAGFDYIDIQSSVNLTLKKVWIADVGGASMSGELKPSIINIESAASGTHLNIVDSEIKGSYDGLRVKSSNTNINIKSSTLVAEIILKMMNGGNQNEISIDDSTLSTGSSITSEYEGISIVGQNNLKINLNNSQIDGKYVGGYRYDDIKLFSIDDKADTSSSNIQIIIRGNSSISLEKAASKKCIFNFGQNNTPSSNVTIQMDSTVKLSTEKVSERYNTNQNYVVVGTYDRYENGIFGNLKVKLYNKNETLTDVQEYSPLQEEGHRFDKWMCRKGENENGEAFVQPYQATENMEVFPQYIETVDVKIEDGKYTIDKGKTLNELEEGKKQEAIQKLNNLKKQNFKKFVDSATGTSLDDVDSVMSYEISQNTEILAVNHISLTVGGQTFLLENTTQTLSQIMNENPDIKGVIDGLKGITVKKFVGFIDIDEENTVIDKDTVLTPKYTVDLTIKRNKDDTGQHYTLNENETLEKLPKEGQDLVAELKNPQPKDKQFKQFETESKDVIGDTTPITEHTTIIAKYTVTITIKKNSNDEGKTFTIDEGQAMQDLTEAEKIQWREYIRGTNKEFVWFREIQDEKTPITKNIILTPVYNVLVTIRVQKEGKTHTMVFTIEEGGKLSDIKNQNLYQSTRTKEYREFSRFVYTDTYGKEQTFNEQSEIIEDIELTSIFCVTVTINKADGSNEKVYVEEGKTIDTLSATDKEKYENCKKNVSRFVYTKDGEEKTFVESEPLNDNIKLTPKYLVTVKIKIGTEGNEDKYKDVIFEEGKKLIDFEDSYKDTKQKDERDFSRFVYTDTYGKEQTFDEQEPVNANITITPKFTVTVTINKTEGEPEKIHVEENELITSIKPEEQAKYESTKSKENREFSRFVYRDTDGKEQTFDTTKPLNDNITLTPKFAVTVIINKAEGEPEKIYVEENELITSIKSEDQVRYEATKLKANREFSKFVYIDANGTEQVFDEEKPLNDNIILTPKFNVKITIGEKTYKQEENKTLADLIVANPEVEAELETLKTTRDREFSRFVDDKGKLITETTIIEDNITILPKFKVTIKVEKPNGTTEQFSLGEGLTLNDLSEEEKQILSEIEGMHEEGEKFAGFVDVANGKIVSSDEQINDDITLKATYEIIPVTPEPSDSPELSTSPEEEYSQSTETTNTNETEETTTPKTSDDIIKYIIGELIAIICIAVATIKIKKSRK